MTTNLVVIANVKQLRTKVGVEFYCLFFRTTWGVGVLNSAIFNSFHNRVEFGKILEGLQNIGGGFEPPPKIPLGTPLAGWAPGLIWTSAENLAPTGIRSPDRPARSQSLIGY